MMNTADDQEAREREEEKDAPRLRSGAEGEKEE
jgi:hypothetical protein